MLAPVATVRAFTVTVADAVPVTPSALVTE